MTIHVPQMAESISEGTLATFNKKVGDRVEADEEIASIETDKIDVPVNSPEAGLITELLVEEGDVVVVGQPLAMLKAGAADGAQEKSTDKSESEATKSSSSGPLESQSVASSPEPQQPAPPPPPPPTSPLTQSPSPTISHPQSQPSPEIWSQSSNPSYPSTVSRSEHVVSIIVPRPFSQLNPVRTTSRPHEFNRACSAKASGRSSRVGPGEARPSISDRVKLH